MSPLHPSLGFHPCPTICFVRERQAWSLGGTSWHHFVSQFHPQGPEQHQGSTTWIMVEASPQSCARHVLNVIQVWQRKLKFCQWGVCLQMESSKNTVIKICIQRQHSSTLYICFAKIKFNSSMSVFSPCGIDTIVPPNKWTWCIEKSGIKHAWYGFKFVLLWGLDYIDAEWHWSSFQ